MTAVDLSRVRFKPGDLDAACREVREAPVDPVDRAVVRVVASFREWAGGVIDGRELQLRALVRREVEDDAHLARRAVEAVRLEDLAEVDAAARRLERRLGAGFAIRDETAVMDALADERRTIEELHARADVRAVRAGEAELSWAHVLRPTSKARTR